MSNFSVDHIIGIDIGTTRAKALRYELGRGIVGWATEQYPTHYPRPGFIEQDPDTILQAVIRVLKAVVDSSDNPPQTIRAVVLGGVWQSLIPVDRKGEALAPASTWADSRAGRQNEHLKEKFSGQRIKRRTGCALHPMYFPARLLWYREEAPEIYKKTYKFISVKEYILYHLFGQFLVDKSIASGTGVWRMSAMDWDKELLEELEIPVDRFSRIVEPTEVIGDLSREASRQTGLLQGTPAVAGAADGALSHLGSVGLSDQKMSMTVGTGAALRKRLSQPAISEGSQAWCYYLTEGNWLLGGIVQDAGNVLTWFSENLRCPCENDERVYQEMNELAAEVGPGAEGLLFLPLLGGERCPLDNPQARGALYGLTFSHKQKHIIRALMEGLCFRLLTVYEMLAGSSNPDLVVTGGLLRSPAWLKIAADFFGRKLWKPDIEETSAWGGLLVGLRSLGVIDSVDRINDWVKLKGYQDPDPQAHALYREVRKAYGELYRRLFCDAAKNSKPDN